MKVQLTFRNKIRALDNRRFLEKRWKLSSEQVLELREKLGAVMDFES